MAISREYVSNPIVTVLHPSLSDPEANILIDKSGRARISGFSLLTIVSDQQTFLSSCIVGGTIPWMSPELLDPKSFGLTKSCLTRESDCYALGMVIYETLSGQAPFFPSTSPVLDVLRGGRPVRPEGAQGAWFTDDIWKMLESCWKPLANDRPSVSAMLLCLQGVVQPSESSLHSDGDVESDFDDKFGATTSSESSTSSQIYPRSQAHLQPHVVVGSSITRHPTMPSSSMLSTPLLSCGMLLTVFAA